MTSTGKIRVIHILPSFGPGGAERLVVDLMEAMDKKRFEVASVSLYPESGTILEGEIKEKGLRRYRITSNYVKSSSNLLPDVGEKHCTSRASGQASELSDTPLRVYFLNKHRGLDLRMIPQLYRLLRAFQPDVVHTHLSVLRYALWPIILCNIPIRVHTVHNPAQKEVDQIGKWVHWVAFRLAGVVPVSVSHEIANTVRSVYGQDVYTPVIYNGVPLDKFLAVPPVGNDNNDNLVILHIGRFAPQKNHRFLMEAFALALKDSPNMQLWLVGEGPLRPVIEQVVMEKGLESNVVFLGLRKDVPELIKRCALVVLSSDWEGMPITILEAMASAKPIVATAVGGVPELVEDGVNGLLVPPGDTYALAKAIVKLAKDSALRYQMGVTGRRKALEKFDITRTAREYEELYSAHKRWVALPSQ